MTEMATIDWLGGGEHLISLKTLLYLSSRLTDLCTLQVTGTLNT